MRLTKGLLRTQEVADLIGISQTKLRRLQADGKLVPVYISPSSHRYYDVEEVNSFLSRYKVERKEESDSYDNFAAEIINLYVDKRMSTRSIAKHYSTNHKRIVRLLKKHCIPLRPSQQLQKWSAERRLKLSEAKRGWKSPMKGTKQSEENRRKNMLGKVKKHDPDFTIDHFNDLDKYLFLSTLFSRERKYLMNDGTSRQAFVDKFYFDPQFNLLYLNWIASEKSKWAVPSLDHKTPISRGGRWSLDNLQFLSWFENKAKAEMTVEEWENFKAATCTSSKLFIGGQ